MNTKRIVSLFASLSLVLSMSLGLTGCGDKAAQDDLSLIHISEPTRP